MRKIFTLAFARSLEFFRDKEALTWNIIMPIFFVMAIAFAFGHGQKPLYKISVVSKSEQALQSLPRLKYIEYLQVDDLQRAQKKLEQHQTDLVIYLEDKWQYWFNPMSEKSDFLNQLFENIATSSFTVHRLEGAKIRYVDWVFPGILAINIMYGALYGIAYVIVRYRKNGYLKRLQATPLTAVEFLLSQVVSRLFISVMMLFIVFISCILLLNPVMNGNVFTLFLLYCIGILCIISLALLLCARVSSEELSRGLLEMAAWPMLLISGAWFSLDQAHYSIQWISQILPLTHLINAARNVMLYGASMGDIKFELMVLTTMTAIFLLLGSLIFKWRQ